MANHPFVKGALAWMALASKEHHWLPLLSRGSQKHKNCIVGTPSFAKREFPMPLKEACTGKTLPGLIQMLPQVFGFLLGQVVLQKPPLDLIHDG